MNVQVIESENKLLVKIPFELKDIFKEIFPNSKWDSDNKKWVLNAKNKLRLTEFIAESSEFVKRIEEEKELQEKFESLSEKEIRLISEKLDVKTHLKNTVKLQEQVSKSLEVISTLKKDMNELAEKLSIEKEELNRDFMQLKEQLSTVIDITDIMDLRQEMIYTYKHVGSREKDRYHAAQGELIKYRDNLKSIGLFSFGINDLISFNFNRPERDNPNCVKEADIYNVQKIDVSE